jgi:hypothetical protein
MDILLDMEIGGFVAVHRWFAQGEGWAYHPWYTPHLRQLITAVQTELENRRNLEQYDGYRECEIEALGGVLFVVHQRDDHCLNETAAKDYPTILRVVFLSNGLLTLEERDRVRQELLRCDPACPGPDPQLRISPPFGQTTPTTSSERSKLSTPTLPPVKTSPRKRSRLTTFVVQGLIVILILSIATLLVATRTGSAPDNQKRKLFDWLQLPFGQKSDSELEQLQSKTAELLQKWEVGQFDRSDVFKTAHAFLKFLSRSSWPDGAQTNQHPDHQFLKCLSDRLPPQPAQPQSKEELRQVLRDLLERLTQRQPEPALSLSQLVEEIAKAMDYRKWWQDHGCKLVYSVSPKDYSRSETADQKVTDFVYRFISPTPEDRANLSWQEPVAKEMVKVLHHWNVTAVREEDAAKRPWFVFHCFFQRLSRVDLPESDLMDFSWEAEFVRRFPKESLSRDGMFSEERELVEALRKLAECLRVERSSVAATLIANIVQGVDYDAWKERAEKVVRLDKESGSRKVSQFVKPFRIRGK